MNSKIKKPTDSYEEDDGSDCLESTITDALKQYAVLKDIGKPAPLKEAQKWYAQLFKDYQGKLIIAVQLGMPQFQQKIPVRQVTQDDLEAILDDCTLMSSMYKTFGDMLTLIFNTYKHPENYTAYKGKIGNVTAYYIADKNESSTARTLDSNLYI